MHTRVLTRCSLALLLPKWRLPPAAPPKSRVSEVCRRRPSVGTVHPPLARQSEAQHFLWNTSAMSMFSSRKQTLNCTCKSHCTVANPTRLRRQHHTCVLQSLRQPAASSQSRRSGSRSHKSARELACRPLWHAAQHRRQLLFCNATRFEDGEAEATGITNNFDDDELTALDGKTSGHAWTATAAPPGMPRPSTSTSCKGCPASF